MKIGNNCNTEINKYLIDENTMDFSSPNTTQFVIEDYGLYFIRTGGYFTYIEGRYYNSSVQMNTYDALLQNGTSYYLLDFKGPTDITLKEFLSIDGTFRDVTINIQHSYNGIRITFNSSGSYYKCFGHSYD